jgi:hypothetical protein
MWLEGAARGNEQQKLCTVADLITVTWWPVLTSVFNWRLTVRNPQGENILWTAFILYPYMVIN